MVLGNCKQLPILTELRSDHHSFEVKLSNSKVPFQVKYDRIACLIDGNQDNSIGRDGQMTDLMGSFKGEHLWLIVLEVDFLDYVVERSVKDLLLGGGKEDVSGEVGRSEYVRDLKVVENHEK